MKPFSFEEQEITVHGQTRPHVTQAHVCNGIAYHEEIGGHEFWTVSHVSTGMAVCNFLPDEGVAKRVANIAIRLKIPTGVFGDKRPIMSQRLTTRLLLQELLYAYETMWYEMELAL